MFKSHYIYDDDFNARQEVGHIVIKYYLESHIATNKDIQNNCALSERQVLRVLDKLGDSVVKIPSGRSPKYALTTSAFGVGDRINIWDVDEQGKHHCIAALRPLSVGGFFVEIVAENSALLLGNEGSGLYEELPFFLKGMAPQGFLGQKIAKELSLRESAFAKNPDDWGDEQVGQYLLSNNDDSLGSLKLGNGANLRLTPSCTRSTPSDYPALADEVMNEDSVMSSAGGEQAKFVSFCTEKQQHVLVKFSPKGDGPSATRWRDILISEYYANKIINRSRELTAATSTLIEKEGRLFLESIRFDRQGEHGRSSMLSLNSVDAEFIGSSDDWVASLTGLHDKALLSQQDLFKGLCLWLFGRLINNTDMHLANMSLSLGDNVFNLLPTYDMCSMGFAPGSNGEVLPFEFSMPDATDTALDGVNVEGVKKMANAYWHKLLAAPEISDEFRVFIAAFLSKS